jgi:hypothetical protein
LLATTQILQASCVSYKKAWIPKSHLQKQQSRCHDDQLI